MAHYVMADLHGEGERFRGMLEKIRFSSEDRLYILGDVVDRGPDGIALLETIMENPNMTLLLGNHEYMMLQYFSTNATEIDHRRWNRNGNAPTLAAFEARDTRAQQKLLTFLSTRPTHLDLTVAGKRFYLIHGFPGDNVHDEVWNRPEVDTPNPIPACQLIIGHTPVLELTVPEVQQDAFLRDLESRGEHLKILHAPGYLDLDCSCGYDIPAKALACLRLEDMAEFYLA